MMFNTSLIRQPHIRITAGYFVVASLWIFFSDSILHSIGIDEELIPGLSILKGIAFVVTTSLLLLLGLRREFQHRTSLENELREHIIRAEQSENRFRKAVEEAPQPIVIFAEDGEITTISRTWMEITGYTREQLGTVESWSNLAYGQQKKPIQEGIDRLFELDGRTDEGEFTIRCADASERIWLFSSTPLGRLPDSRRIVMSIATDVTERAKAERQLHVKDSAIEATVTPIALADMEAQLTYVNPAFVEMWKLEDKAQAIGRSIHEFWLSPATAEKVTNTLLERGVFTGELTAKLADENIADVEVTASMVRDESGQPICLIGSFKNVTEQKRADAYALENERLKANFQQEQDRNAFVMRIISALSHDLRTPLTVILTSKDLLMNYFERMKPEKRLEKLDIIGRQIQFALNLLEDTVAMARGHLGDVPFRPIPVNIAALCQVSVNELRASEQFPQPLEFTNHFGTEFVKIDELLVSRILLNLLSNAVKYSSDMSPVRLELAREDEKIILRVIDHGIGISHEVLPHIFDPFYRSDEVTDIAGTGLGLSIVKDCVERHGGEIHVESEVGQGTTFTVKLPLVLASRNRMVSTGS